MVLLSRRVGATRRREQADAAADVLVDMSQPMVNEDEIIEGGGDGVEERPNPRPAGRKGNSGRRRMTEEEQERAAPDLTYRRDETAAVALEGLAVGTWTKFATKARRSWAICYRNHPLSATTACSQKLNLRKHSTT